MTRNLTLAVDDSLLDRFRLHAAEKRTSVNALIRQMMEDAVGQEARRKESVRWMVEMAQRNIDADAARSDSGQDSAPLDLSRESTYAERMNRWPKG
jgi:plasmid stability protein